MIKFLIFIFLQYILFTLAQKNCTTIDNQIGKCIPPKSCTTMVEAFDKIPQPIAPPLMRYLRTYKCNSEGEDYTVCCPPKPIYFDIYSNQNYLNLLSEPPDVSNHKNLKLLPEECGFFDKTISRQKAGLFEFPWMTALFYKEKNGSFEHRCGGTIINEKYILTAAHCLDKSPAYVRVGDYDLKNTTDCETLADGGLLCAPPFQDLEIEEMIPYHRYDKQLHHHDVALLRVSPINLTHENSQPVCLPLQNYRNYNFTNSNGIVVGWGVTENNNWLGSDVLLKAEVPIIPLETCLNIYRGLHIGLPLYERQMCAGGIEGKDSCAGDSGGPILSIGILDGTVRHIQQGIVSYGLDHCGQKDIPLIYTRVAYFMDWILDNLKA